MRRTVTTAYHLTCIATLIALAVVSLLPAELVQRTEIGGRSEHLLAYAGAGLVLGLGSSRRTWLPWLHGLIAYAALLETLQLFAPGRSPQIGDFLYSAAGCVSGFLIAWMLRKATG